MFDLVLHQPQIPPNTGNIIRLCANSGAGLHLIEPLGFDLDEKSCRRAGLDYRDMSVVTRWPNFDAFRNHRTKGKIWLITKFGEVCYSEAQFSMDDAFVFGSEQHGLPHSVLQSVPKAQRLYLPMLAESRSLNLSNTAAIILYEAWRQHNFTNSQKVHSLEID